MESGQGRDGGHSGKGALRVWSPTRDQSRRGGRRRARSRHWGGQGPLSPGGGVGSPLAHLHAWRSSATTAGARGCAELGGRRSGWGARHGREVCLAARRWSRRGGGSPGRGAAAAAAVAAGDARFGWARLGSAGLGWVRRTTRTAWSPPLLFTSVGHAQFNPSLARLRAQLLSQVQARLRRAAATGGLGRAETSSSSGCDGSTDPMISNPPSSSEFLSQPDI